MFIEWQVKISFPTFYKLGGRFIRVKINDHTFFTLQNQMFKRSWVQVYNSDVHQIFKNSHFYKALRIKIHRKDKQVCLYRNCKTQSCLFLILVVLLIFYQYQILLYLEYHFFPTKYAYNWQAYYKQR